MGDAATTVIGFSTVGGWGATAIEVAAFVIGSVDKGGLIDTGAGAAIVDPGTNDVVGLGVSTVSLDFTTVSSSSSLSPKSPAKLLSIKANLFCCTFRFSSFPAVNVGLELSWGLTNGLL